MTFCALCDRLSSRDGLCAHHDTDRLRMMYEYLRPRVSRDLSGWVLFADAFGLESTNSHLANSVPLGWARSYEESQDIQPHPESYEVVAGWRAGFIHLGQVRKAGSGATMLKAILESHRSAPR